MEPDCLGMKLYSATDEPHDLGQVLGFGSPVCKIEIFVVGDQSYLFIELVRAFKEVTFARHSEQHSKLLTV